MRACGTACRAHITDHIALTDALSRGYALAIFRKMKICCRIYGIVSDPHGLAACTLVLYACHDTVTDGHDRGSHRGGIVNSRVGTDLLGHRMTTGI